jgi:two-component system, chemotaxis family, protein-glutamate methylesterase/glutaminase
MLGMTLTTVVRVAISHFRHTACLLLRFAVSHYAVSPRRTMSNRDVVVIGGSAGAIEAVREILRKLPGELPAAICVVIHSSPDGSSLLPQVLGRCSNLPTAFARHDEPVQTGRVYIAPPDQHLLISDGRMHVAYQ